MQLNITIHHSQERTLGFEGIYDFTIAMRWTIKSEGTDGILT